MRALARDPDRSDHLPDIPPHDPAPGERDPDRDAEREPAPAEAAPEPTIESAEQSASRESPAIAEATARSRRIGLAGCAATVLVVVLLAVLAIPRLLPDRPRLTQEEVRSLVSVTLQREARAAFLVTGTLELTATTRVRNTKTVLPGLLDLSLGSAESTVRVPGRVSYGIAVSDVRTADIRLSGDTVYLSVPAPRVHAVEPQLDRMEVQSEAGWLRIGEDAVPQTQQRAVGLVLPALRAQAERHLADSEQARINTAETLHELLRPVFEAAGLRDPVFRFQLSERLQYTGEGER